MSANLDLTSCDQEKIHLFTSIQEHGAFLSLHKIDHKVHNVSENLSAFFGLTEESSFFLHKRLVDILPLELATKIQQHLRSNSPFQSGLEHVLDSSRTVEVHLYSLADELVGVEFEIYETQTEKDKISGINNYLERMQNGKTLAEVSEVACSAVRYLSGFDRVMIYRFFPPDMYGEVIAEDRVASAQTFLHHRFPATDIPKPARDLYLRNKVRYIHDAAAESSRIYPPVYDKKIPLDLSDSRLRSVSKIHLEYLKNMGVRGSMSVAIIVEGNLWGIISCHHPEPQYVSQGSRRLCLQVANTLAMIAPLMENLTRYSYENSYYTRLHDFFSEINQESDPLSSLFKKVDKLNALFSSHGVAYVTPSKVTTAGITPLSKNMKEVWEVLRKKMTSDIFETQKLSTLDEKFADLKDEASGILAIKVSPLDDAMLIFTRPEKLITVLWGGDPRKNLSEREYKGQINPRASFETWTEVVKGSSLPWSGFELKGARNFRSMVFDSLVRKEQLIGELHERLKNKS